LRETSDFDGFAVAPLVSNVESRRTTLAEAGLTSIFGTRKRFRATNAERATFFESVFCRRAKTEYSARPKTGKENDIRRKNETVSRKNAQAAKSLTNSFKGKRIYHVRYFQRRRPPIQS
jgi:hypothetical protein